MFSLETSKRYERLTAGIPEGIDAGEHRPGAKERTKKRAAAELAEQIRIAKLIRRIDAGEKHPGAEVVYNAMGEKDDRFGETSEPHHAD